MDPKTHAPLMLAPGASSSTPLRFPAAERSRPRLDDHVMREEERWELVDGQRYDCMANEEHSIPQSTLDRVLGAAAAPGYHALVELTTRHDWDNDFMSDVCIKRVGKDPQTGERYLEELAFEVANTETLAHVKKKARRMAERGVRRVFALQVKTGQLLEWSREQDDFVILGGDAVIEDPCLATPLRLKTLLDSAEADDAVVRALAAKGNRALAQLREEGQVQGQQQALREAIGDMCELLGIEVSADRRAQLAAMDLDRLVALKDALKRTRSWGA